MWSLKRFYRNQVLNNFSARRAGFRTKQEAVKSEFDKRVEYPFDKRGYSWAKGGGALNYITDVRNALIRLYGRKRVENIERYGDINEFYFKNVGKAFNYIAFEKRKKR